MFPAKPLSAMTPEDWYQDDPGDWDDDEMSNCCHPGHPSNYGDS